MSVDLFSRVNFTDGEALDLDDLENIGAYAQIAALDQILAGRVPFVADVAGTAVPEVGDVAYGQPYAYALHAGQAVPAQGSDNSKVKITAGTLLQAIAAIDGLTPSVLAYTFVGTEEVEIDDAAGATPRVDIVQMALTVIDDTTPTRDFEDSTTREPSSSATAKRKRVSCALSVKKGTPAASPIVPTLDAGCVAIATVLIGASYAAAAGFKHDDTAGAVAVLHDQRMPLGIRAVTVRAKDHNYVGTDCTPVGLNEQIQMGAPATAVYAVCPTGDTAGRVIAISTMMTDPSILAVWLGRLRHYDSGGAAVSRTIMNGANVNGSGADTYRRRFGGCGVTDGLHAPAAGPDVTANAAGLGVPVWSNGRRGWVNASAIDPLEISHAILLQTSCPNTTVIGPSTFWIAGG